MPRAFVIEVNHCTLVVIRLGDVIRNELAPFWTVVSCGQIMQRYIRIYSLTDRVTKKGIGWYRDVKRQTY